MIVNAPTWAMSSRTARWHLCTEPVVRYDELQATLCGMRITLGSRQTPPPWADRCTKCEALLPKREES